VSASAWKSHSCSYLSSELTAFFEDWNLVLLVSVKRRAPFSFVNLPRGLFFLYIFAIFDDCALRRTTLLSHFFLYFACPNSFTRFIQAQCIHWFLDRLKISMAHVCRYCHLHLWLSQKRPGFFPYVLARTNTGTCFAICMKISSCCLVHFRSYTDACDFYHTYCQPWSLCRKLRGIIVHKGTKKNHTVIAEYVSS
jgi:hypothetical protein